MKRVLAIGPSTRRLSDHDRTWLRIELGRSLGRLRRKYGKIEMMLDMSHGLAEDAYEAAVIGDAALSVWVAHPSQAERWGPGQKAVLKGEPRPSFYTTFHFDRDKFGPEQYYQHLLHLISVSDVILVVDDGSHKAQRMARACTRRPRFLFDLRSRRVQWGG